MVELTYKTLFTPLFILLAIAIFIVGLIGLQVLDRLFAGSKNLNSIRMFGITITFNVIILLFLIMSFGRVKIEKGPKGPQGNKGDAGNTGNDGGLVVCGQKYQTVEEKKTFEKALNYLDLKNPLIVND
jgi:hypothetical protein